MIFLPTVDPPPKDIPQSQFFLRAGRVLKSGSQLSCLKILWTFLLFFCLGIPCLKRLWLFYCFLCLKSPSEKSLNISSFFHSEIPVWKDFEYFTIVSVWNPHLKRFWKLYDFSCLKILWIFHDFLNLKSPPEKTLKIS